VLQDEARNEGPIQSLVLINGSAPCPVGYQLHELATWSGTRVGCLKRMTLNVFMRPKSLSLDSIIYGKTSPFASKEIFFFNFN